MNQQTEIDVKGRQNEEMEIDLLWIFSGNM